MRNVRRTGCPQTTQRGFDDPLTGPARIDARQKPNGRISICFRRQPAVDRGPSALVDMEEDRSATEPAEKTKDLIRVAVREHKERARTTVRVMRRTHPRSSQLEVDAATLLDFDNKDPGARKPNKRSR